MLMTVALLIVPGDHLFPTHVVLSLLFPGALILAVNSPNKVLHFSVVERPLLPVVPCNDKRAV